MSEIPGDILKMAAEAIGKIDGPRSLTRQEIVAQYILAERKRAVEDVLDMLCCHELYQYRPKAFKGFVEYARAELVHHPLSIPTQEAE